MRNPKTEKPAGGTAGLHDSDHRPGGTDHTSNADEIAPTQGSGKPWRDVLPVHPAAKIFPPLSAEERRALGADIAKHGLKQPIVLINTPDEWPGHAVLDGCNRLDALFDVGLAKIIRAGEQVEPGEISLVDIVQLPKCAAVYAPDDVDPVAYVMSANHHRRHETAEQKREVIAAALKLDPGLSNRQIAEKVKASHHKVAVERERLASTGQIAQLEKTVGKDGKARPVKAKPKSEPKPEASPAAEPARIPYPKSPGPKAAAVPACEPAIPAFLDRGPAAAPERTEHRASRADVCAAIMKTIDSLRTDVFTIRDGFYDATKLVEARARAALP